MRRNVIKVLLGFFAGTVLLYFICSFNFVLISVIQTVFFIAFYTVIDKIIMKCENYVETANTVGYIEASNYCRDMGDIYNKRQEEKEKC